MTPRQIKTKLEKAGFNMDCIVNVKGDEVEILAKNKKGEVSQTLTNKAKNDAYKILGFSGGYKTGCGSWVIRNNYESLGDFNDKASKHHY